MRACVHACMHASVAHVPALHNWTSFPRTGFIQVVVHSTQNFILPIQANPIQSHSGAAFHRTPWHLLAAEGEGEGLRPRPRHHRAMSLSPHSAPPWRPVLLLGRTAPHAP
jgi:hypothetical protein